MPDKRDPPAETGARTDVRTGARLVNDTQPVGWLKKRADYLRLNAKSRKQVGTGMVLLARHREPPTQEPEAATALSLPPRFGITATRKIGNAVIRNRAKRRLRALIRELGPELAQPGYDYVLIARHNTVTLAYTALARTLRTSLRRIHRPDHRPDHHRPDDQRPGSKRSSGPRHSGQRAGQRPKRRSRKS